VAEVVAEATTGVERIGEFVGQQSFPMSPLDELLKRGRLPGTQRPPERRLDGEKRPRDPDRAELPHEKAVSEEVP